MAVVKLIMLKFEVAVELAVELDKHMLELPKWTRACSKTTFEQGTRPEAARLSTLAAYTKPQCASHSMYLTDRQQGALVLVEKKAPFHGHRTRLALQLNSHMETTINFS